LILGVSLSAQSTHQPQQAEKKCHWWQFTCEEAREGLPAEAPRSGMVVTIDVARNRLYLFKDGELVDQSLAATGISNRSSGKISHSLLRIGIAPF